MPKSKYGQAIGYCAESVARAPPVHGEWPFGDRQQHFGADVATVRDRAEKLDVPGQRPRGRDGGDLFQHPGERQARYRIEPFAYVRALLIAFSSDEVNLETLLPDVWIAAHPEHFLQYRRDEAEAAARRGNGVARNVA